MSDLAAAADASGVSDLEAAQNIMTTLTTVVLTPPDDIEKAAEEQRYVLGIAYQAGRNDKITKGLDGARDYFTPVELEKAAWSFLQAGPRVGLYHVDGTDQNGGAATVVESYIYRNPVPWDLGNGLVAKSGDWLVGAILDDRAWGLYKAGKITGWSPQGVARRRRAAKPA